MFVFTSVCSALGTSCVPWLVGETSRLKFESFAPGPFAAHPAALSQKRGLVFSVQDGLRPTGHVGVASSLDSPPTHRAELPQDVEQAISVVADTLQEEIRPFRIRTLKKPKGGAAKHDGRRRPELLEVSSRPFLRETRCIFLF